MTERLSMLSNAPQITAAPKRRQRLSLVDQPGDYPLRLLAFSANPHPPTRSLQVGVFLQGRRLSLSLSSYANPFTPYKHAIFYLALNRVFSLAATLRAGGQVADTRRHGHRTYFRTLVLIICFLSSPNCLLRNCGAICPVLVAVEAADGTPAYR